jgi:glucosamine kinase
MLYLGLDAGGTKTNLAGQENNDGAHFKISGGGANLQRAGLQSAATVLAGLVDEAIRSHPGHEGVNICAGVAGAGRTSDQDALRARLREMIQTMHPSLSVNVLVVHDASIALEAAFEGESGAILISGTGSVVFGRTPEGRVERAGGWGYLLGDEGSGNAIGIRGLRAICAMYDGGPETDLAEMAREKFGLKSANDVIECVYGKKWPPQNVAPLVVEAARHGDNVASDILADEAGMLADQLAWLADRRPDIAPRVALIGGLARASHYEDVLTAAIRDRLPGWEVRRDTASPVEGALGLAKKIAVAS